MSFLDRVYTPTVINNMVEASVPEQTKRKFVNLSVFKNFIKFKNSKINKIKKYLSSNLKNICNIKIKEFLLCQYAIYGPVRIILTEDEINIILTGPYITY